MLDELWCSNGMAWSADSSEMYLTDLYITTAPTPGHRGLGGAIFKLDTGVAGVPVNRFGPIPA
jgi:sugar lactone lactonase YvrE